MSRRIVGAAIALVSVVPLFLVASSQPAGAWPSWWPASLRRNIAFGTALTYCPNGRVCLSRYDTTGSGTSCSYGLCFTYEFAGNSTNWAAEDSLVGIYYSDGQQANDKVNSVRNRQYGSQRSVCYYRFSYGYVTGGGQVQRQNYSGTAWQIVTLWGPNYDGVSSLASVPPSWACT